ncbi:hypothetical protein ACFQV2_04300 [Actinokineospora soli]|uniref:Uncharacterized protein n=1 Tax=Actinokineospora soli TaxID=1048753 RepID=A0ABW2TH15_9PSEU
MVTQHEGDPAGFSVVRHGFDRTQVKQYLRRMEDDSSATPPSATRPAPGWRSCPASWRSRAARSRR